jgi:hypothetical protein
LVRKVSITQLVKSTGNLSLEEPVTPAESTASDNFQFSGGESEDVGTTSEPAPKVSRPTTPVTTADSKPVKPGYTGSLKILIVEDNLVSRNLLVQAVKATGVPHMEALDGAAAGEAYQKWQPTHDRFIDVLVVRRNPVADGVCRRCQFSSISGYPSSLGSRLPKRSGSSSS